FPGEVHCPEVGAYNQHVAQVPAVYPYPSQRVSQQHPAEDTRHARSGPEDQQEGRRNQFDSEEHGKRQNEHCSHRSCLQHVRELGGLGPKPPGIVESKGFECKVPCHEKEEEQDEVPYLHSHGEKLFQRESTVAIKNQRSEQE